MRAKMSDEEQMQPSLLHSTPESAATAENSAFNDHDVELAETVRQMLEEIGSSSSRIAKSLERLNSLAQETYCELDATRRALSLRG